MTYWFGDYFPQQDPEEIGQQAAQFKLEILQMIDRVLSERNGLQDLAKADVMPRIKALQEKKYINLPLPTDEQLDRWISIRARLGSWRSGNDIARS